MVAREHIQQPHSSVASGRVHIPIPRPDQRVIAFGKTGSGKSVLLRRIIAAAKNVVIIDTKKAETRDWKRIKGAQVTSVEPHRLGSGIWIWQPSDRWLFDREAKDRTFWNLYRQRGPRVIFIDEFGDMASPPGSNVYPSSLQVLAMRGRAARKGLWGTTQRPHLVPLYLVSEANHYFVFELNLERDQKRINQVLEQTLDYSALGPEAPGVPPGAEHSYRFYYRGAGGRVQGPTWLNKEDLI